MLEQLNANIKLLMYAGLAIAGFAAGWFLASYLDARTAERLAAIHQQETIDRQAIVTQQQAKIIAYQIEQARIKHEAEVQHENAVNAINLVMDTQRVQHVPIERICGGGLPATSTGQSGNVATSTLFERYDSALAEVRRASIETVRQCELERERLIEANGGR